MAKQYKALMLPIGLHDEIKNQALKNGSSMIEFLDILLQEYIATIQEMKDGIIDEEKLEKV